MSNELPSFLKKLKEKDSKYAENVIENFCKNFSSGELSAKTKVLIALALDANEGDLKGVKALSERAKDMGVTEKELIEVIEVVEATCGLQGLSTAIKALD